MLKRIYADFINGLSYDDIVKGLITDSIPTRHEGASGAVTTITNMLSNEKHSGDCLFQKAFIQDPISHKSKRNRGELPQYLVEDCLPVIIDKETWNIAQEMRKRHTAYSKSPSEEYPFREIMYCSVCGSSFGYYYFSGVGRVRIKAFRCLSRRNSGGAEIPGMTYTQPRKANYTKNPTAALVEYRERYCKGPQPRQMLCTDIRIASDKPEKAFVSAWNLIVSRKIRYRATLQRTAESADNALTRYRANEMIRLLDEVGRLDSFNFPLMLKTIDRIDVLPDGKLTFLFQSGVRITV